MTDYGSGIYPGPTATAPIQDAGWAQPGLQWGLLGDSISVRCASRFRTAFATAGVDSFAVRAHSGQNWEGSNDWLESLTNLPENLIVELGTNDVQDPFGVPEQIQRTKDILGPDRRLIFVDTYVARSAYLVHDLRNSGQVNGYIRQAATDDAHVADWVANLTALIGRGKSISLYIQDGVHPWIGAADGHGDGCNFFVAIVMQTVQPFLV